MDDYGLDISTDGLFILFMDYLFNLCMDYLWDIYSFYIWITTEHRTQICELMLYVTRYDV